MVSYVSLKLNTVVLGAVDGCNNNRCDSDVSFFDTFCISAGHVRYSPIPSQISHAHCSLSQLDEPDSPDLQKAKRLVSHTKDSSVTHIPSNRLEVTVHTTYPEEYSMSQTNNYGSYPSSDAQFSDKPHELGSDDDVEGDDEK
jgi:hypothetical protein